MKKKTEPGSIVTDYYYDTENHLTRVDKNGNNIALYYYDGDGGRQKTIVGGVITTYVGSLYEESGTRKTKYFFLGDTRVASSTNGNILYYHGDHLGSANVLTDASGVKKELTEYEPFGKISRSNKLGSSDEIARYYFTGQKLDDETGLYFYNARYYDPSLGRFISPDTIVQSPSNPQTLNRYTYAGNNPVNNIDPTGHSFWKSFLRGFVGAVVNVFASSFLGPWLGGAIAGAFTAAVFGGNGQAIAMGAGFGFLLGGAFGTTGSNGFLGDLGPPIGLAALVGGGIYSYQEGGGQGAFDYLGGVIGGIAGFGSGNTIKNSFKDSTAAQEAAQANAAQDPQVTIAKAESIAEKANHTEDVVQRSIEVTIDSVEAGEPGVSDVSLGDFMMGISMITGIGELALEAKGLFIGIKGGLRAISDSSKRLLFNEGGFARIGKISKAESSIWKNLKPFKGDIKTSGVGRDKQFYKWDYTHGEIEIYGAKGQHLGAMDPVSGEMIKGPVNGRTLGF